MWAWLSSRILRNRAPILVVLGLLTIFFAYEMKNVEVSYKFGGLLPSSDSAYVHYQELLANFSEDGNVIVLGVQDPALYKVENFKEWWQLGQDLKQQAGVDSVFSEAHLFELVRDDSLRKFQLAPIIQAKPSTQAEVDSIVRKVRSLPFYKDLLYNDSSNASLMMVFVNADRFNSEDRGDMVDLIEARVDEYAQGRFKVYRSGLPFIRTVVTERTKTEMRMFVGLMMLTVAVLLLLFFKSWRVMFVCLLVVVVGVIWAVGSIGLLGYKLTSVMAIIPPLVIVIGIPNCIFLINKYHFEISKHHNKMLALMRVVHRVGMASLMTNTTTALGFATFVLTYSDVLKQFGLIASMNIMAVFVLSIVLVPILFSYQGRPNFRHLAHLDRKWVDNSTTGLINIVQHHRRWVYVITLLVVVIGLFGVSKLKNESHVVDDLPADDPVMKDLGFFEQQFNGVMPLEVIVDTRKKGQALKDVNLKKIEQLQTSLSRYPELSRSLSIVDAIKFTKQSFYSGDPERYELIKANEKAFILPYLENAQEKGGMARSFIDEERSKTRITLQIADVGTARMDDLMAEFRTEIDSIFDPQKYRVLLTGTSVVFLEGSKYMVSNLIISLILAVILISGIMALLFNSFRMVLISLIPNLIPLIATAGMMGYLDIHIKPSTILVFSIAFGISVDNA
ncbi:MAG: MMPL family transporter, partial [Bacteroidota bacterium]|nr:MMPL family transporter [Bacteroidota bacterium]